MALYLCCQNIFKTPMLIYFGFRTHASFMLRIPESRVSSSSCKVRVKGVKLKGIQLNICCVWGHKFAKIVFFFYYSLTCLVQIIYRL